MDVWVYNQHYGDKLDRVYIERELSKAGLLKFAKAVESLAAAWFGGKEMNELDNDLGSLFISNGTYGTSKSATTVSVNNQEGSFGKAKRSYIMHMLFPPLKKMRIIYPILDKAPFLLPFTWVARGVKKALFARLNVKAKLHSAGKVDEDEVLRIKKLNVKLGF